jgi:hypothetical protein
MSVLRLSRSPRGRVPPEAPVEVTWPEGLRRVAAPEVRAGGSVLDVEVGPTERGVVLRPTPRWPLGARVVVDLEGGLEGPMGEAVPVAPVVFEVVSEADGGELAAEVRSPPPGERAPPNAAWLGVAAPVEVRELVLETASGAEARLLTDAGEAGLRVFEVRGGGACAPLCAGTVYRLRAPGEVAPGPRGEVRTATAPDLRSPSLRALRARGRPGELELRGEADEIVLARGVWRADGTEGELRRLSGPGRSFRLLAAPAPPAGARVAIDLEVVDLAGLATSTRAFAVMPEVPSLVISEVVTTPRRDWGDSGPNGEPFDAWPGDGAVTSSDEWIELVHRGARPLDLEDVGLELRTLDGSPEITAVAKAPALRFGDGGRPRRWRPGEALVVRPRGNMSQRDLAIELWAGALLLDRIVLATDFGADHPGGAPPSLVHEALARTAEGSLRWCRPTPGDPLPAYDCWAPREDD